MPGQPRRAGLNTLFDTFTIMCIFNSYIETLTSNVFYSDNTSRNPFRCLFTLNINERSLLQITNN